MGFALLRRIKQYDHRGNTPIEKEHAWTSIPTAPVHKQGETLETFRQRCFVWLQENPLAGDYLIIDTDLVMTAVEHRQLQIIWKDKP